MMVSMMKWQTVIQHLIKIIEKTEYSMYFHSEEDVGKSETEMVKN